MEKEIIKNKQNNNDIQEKIDFEPDLKKQLFQLRTFLDNNDWINFFLDLQKIITEQIADFFYWNKIFNKKIYLKFWMNKKHKLLSIFNQVISKKESKEYFIFLDEVNLYQNTICNYKSLMNKESKELFKTWNNYSDLNKKIKTFHFYHSLMNFIIFLCLIREEKYKKSRKK